MKRISTAAVAAATALSLATVPAMAQEAETNQTASDQPATDQPAGQPEGETNQPEGETNQPEGETNQPEGESDQPADQGKTNQGKTNKSSGSSQGTLVGVFAGTLGAVLTTALIVFSDPRGANKIVDMVNAQFGLGLPHLHTPKVELPNFQLPNLPF
ncbi:putative low-complexity protein [Corynebacterium afermentans]